MNKCIIFDIDGTVADLSHRVHHVNGTKKNWVAFMATLSDDKPIEQTIFLNNLLFDYCKLPIFFASGRSEDERAVTEAWLEKEGLEYEHLFMRPSKDYRADHIIKREILAEIRSKGFEPWLIFDDRQQVVDMWRSEGLFVLQADPKKNFTDHEAFKFHPSIKYPLTIMVGPSGAGKSTWIEKNCHPGSVISSDQIREELCGDFRDQSKNLQVFEAMHELARTRLRAGLPVVLDATHIRAADRKKPVSLVPSDTPVRYVVVNRPLAEKHRDAGWRASVSIKGATLIDKHDQVFQSNLKAISNGDGFANVTVDFV